MKRLFLLLPLATLAGGVSLITAGQASAQTLNTPWTTTVTTVAVAERVISPPRAHRVPAPKPERVTVRPGDSLSAIGANTHRTWQQLAGYNHVQNPNLIYAGAVLTIPPASYVPPPIALPTPAPSYSPPVTHYTAPVRSYSAPAPTPVVSYGGGGGGGSFTGVWACIAQHESGGNAGTNTGNGYYGGLQFTLGTWQANGGSGNPANASAAEQQRVAQNVVNASGGSYGAWPVTSGMCGV